MDINNIPSEALAEKEKTAEFLADCLAHMPDQPEQLQCAIDTVIDGLKRISNGGQWPEEQARAASNAAAWAARAASNAAAWAARAAAAWVAWEAAAWMVWTADYAAHWAALAHPDPDAERARQKAKREELGI